MTLVLADLLVISILAGVSAYRITRLIVSDEILRPWRERHGIAVEGYRGADGTWYTAYTDAQPCVPELQTQKGYEDAIARYKSLSWPFLWLRVLFTQAFWLRAFSCEQCASVWVSAFLAGGAVLVMSAITASLTWLCVFPVVALVTAGIASALLQTH